MRVLRALLASALVLSLGASSGYTRPQNTEPRTNSYRTLNDRFVVRHPKSLDEWRTRARWLREKTADSSRIGDLVRF